MQAARRGRISRADIAGRLSLIADLPISVDQETTAGARREILLLAWRENLTTYDAAYLELAERQGLPLTTRDTALADAARRSGVGVIP